MSMLVSGRPTNYVLQSLSDADFALVKPHLKPVELTRGSVLYNAGEPIHRVFFPDSGIISSVVELASGQAIEIAMIGRDTVAGGLFALDGKVSLYKGIVQLAGSGWSVDVDKLRAAASASPSFARSLVVHEQIVFAQAQQAAACNAVHSLEARMARWLLYVRELIDGETLQLTQEFLSQILGVQRSSISLVAARLQQRGLIHYRRGRLVIERLDDLRKVACECYDAVKSHRDRLLSEG
jgi:CRP-like cAMP-binding protein